ncbi:TonB-dependent receptor [Gemmatimonadota bacterium]
MNKSVFIILLALNLSQQLPTAIGEPRDTVFTLDTLTVTATRTGSSAEDLPAALTVLGSGQIKSSPGVLLDEILSAEPAFSLFRRSGSLVAHPTAQGVSLRGIGATSTSRTLVLMDGMPLNDPFGGWIGWGRINAQSVRRVEVMRGGPGYLWGNYAMGGVINIVTGPPRNRTISFAAYGGSLDTWSAQFSTGRQIGVNSLAIEGGWFDSGGHPVLRDNQRGAIDTDADSRNWNVSARFSRPVLDNVELFFRGGFYGEERSNGTVLTGNGTDGGWGSIGLGVNGSGGGRLHLGSFFQSQTFHSTFSSQAANRSNENPALDQYDVPGTAFGTTAEWIKPLGNSHTLSTGVDFRFHTGETNERYFFSGGNLTRQRSAGGDQFLAGFYVHDTWSPTGSLYIDLGVRADRWRQSGGFRREVALDATQVFRDESYGARDGWVLQPGAGILYRADRHLALRMSAYRTFRAPTLNELYRPFRVRNDITDANPNLDPEKLTGIEAGFDITGPVARFSTTVYWNRISAAIANLTGGYGPGQVDPCGFVPAGGSCSQRANLGRVRAAGVELELEFRLHRALSFETSWLYSNSTVRYTAGHPELAGKRLPQVPSHTVVAAFLFREPLPLTGTLQFRGVGRQYEDDFNGLALAGYATLDFYLERSLSGVSSIFLRGRNLLDRVYPVGVTADGLVSIGSPRRVHAGFRTGF